MLVEHGLSSIKALCAATSMAMRVLRFHDLGIIRKGARVDLVAFAGDPTATIGALREVRYVMREGI